MKGYIKVYKGPFSRKEAVRIAMGFDESKHIVSGTFIRARRNTGHKGFDVFAKFRKIQAKGRVLGLINKR